MKYNPYDDLVGGFSSNDGTIDFYLRINSLIRSTDVVLDLGAGRGAWFEDDNCEIRREIRLLRGKVSQLIAADVDMAVLDNRASDKQLVIKDGVLDLQESSVDLVIADFVLEHISDPENFVKQIEFVLKSGGWFCARTPHRFSYVAMASSLLKNSSHGAAVEKIQPGRKEADVFPAFYKLNTIADIQRQFFGWKNKSFIFRTDPAYFFGSRAVFKIQDAMHRLMPKPLCGNIFVFMQKLDRC